MWHTRALYPPLAVQILPLAVSIGDLEMVKGEAGVRRRIETPDMHREAACGSGGYGRTAGASRATDEPIHPRVLRIHTPELHRN